MNNEQKPQHGSSPFAITRSNYGITGDHVGQGTTTRGSARVTSWTPLPAARNGT
jgi:hypothetical protein